jgi:hypothetical protein
MEELGTFERSIDELLAHLTAVTENTDTSQGINKGAACTVLAETIIQRHSNIIRKLAELATQSANVLSLQRVTMAVQMADGESFSIRVVPGAMVADAKASIETVKGYPSLRQRIFVVGQEEEEDIADEVILDDFFRNVGISDEACTLLLVLKEPPVVAGSTFYNSIFDACGKMPAKPDPETLATLLASPEFSGDPDQYLDENGSSLLMYAAGPVTPGSLPVIKVTF